MVQSPCSSHLFNKVSYSTWLTQPRLKWPLSLVYTAHVGASFGQISILIWLSQSFSSLPSQEGHWIPSNTEEKKKCWETYREFNFGNRLRDKKKKNRLIFPFFPWRIIGWESGFSAERLVNVYPLSASNNYPTHRYSKGWFEDGQVLAAYHSYSMLTQV